MNAALSGPDTAASQSAGSRGSVLASIAAIPGLKVIVAVYAVSRLLLLAIPVGLFPYPAGVAVQSDTILYTEWAQVIAAGHFPIADPFWQYPPAAGAIFWLSDQLGNPFGFMMLAFICDIVIFSVLLYRGMTIIRDRRTNAADPAGSPADLDAPASDNRPLGAAWVYVVGGIAVGPVLFCRFDIFPTLFAVLALMCLTKPVRSGIWMGIGALLKLWPALLVLALPRRTLPKGLAAIAAVGIIGMSAAFMYGVGSLSFLGEQRDRGIQTESVGALPYVIARALGFTVDNSFRYGALEVDMAGTEQIGMLLTVVGLAGIGWVAYLRLRGRLERIGGADVALALVLISIATSRVFSPQYMIWVVGIAAVCMLDPATRMRPIIGLVLVTTLLGQLLYPTFYASMTHGEWPGVLIQTLRIALLVTATIWALALIMRRPRDPGGQAQPA